MKIAILGTRGIPNQYGGFEQFAEYASKGFVDRGHEVSVYCSSNHTYKGKFWDKVRLIHIFDPEQLVGTMGQFVYDLLCILDSRRRGFDVILQLGYTSSSIWGFLLPKKSIIVTNMDGLEWRRSKFSAMAQRFLMYAEKLAIKTSDFLIADSKGIKSYLENKHGVGSEFIAYGANVPDHFDDHYLNQYDLTQYDYNMLIARLEPENHIEVILEGVYAAQKNGKSLPFLVIGKTASKYGTYLKEKYGSDVIRFLGGIYDLNGLNALRRYCNLYFHGHSVGGTNPSLLEAMASSSAICAHENVFNRSVLGDDATYFRTSKDVEVLLAKFCREESLRFVENNLIKIHNYYDWKLIIDSYESFLLKCVTHKLN